MEEIPPEISNKICKELEEKQEELSKYLREKQEVNNKLGIIQIHRHQLAISKILVSVHGRSPYILVKAHGNLSESYFSAEYYEASIDHLTSALKLNMTLFESIKDSQNYHIHLLTNLGKCNIFLNKTSEALDILQKALKSNQNMNGPKDISNTSILSALSKVHFKQKEHSKALEYLTEVWEIYESKFGMKHEIMIEVYTDMAEIYKSQGDTKNAVEILRRKLYLMHELEIFNNSLAETFEKCGVWLQELFMYPQAIDAFREAEKIYIQNNGMISKVASKLKRKICGVLVKIEEYEEAVKECKELEEIDKSLYGEYSSQYAKDLKVIGTVSMIISKNLEALKYFNKALEVYTRLRNSKAVKEVRSKLETLTKGNKEKEEL